MRRLLTVAAILMVALPAGCQPTTEGEEPVETVSLDEAAIRVHQRAQTAAELLDVPLRNPRRTPVPCSDPSGNLSQTGVYYMSATQQLRVGENRVAEAVRAMHAYYAGQGFEVEEIRWSPDDSGAGQLRATDPDGFGYAMVPTLSRNGYSFSVYSPCYQAPDGEDPTDGRWHPPPTATGA